MDVFEFVVAKVGEVHLIVDEISELKVVVDDSAV